MATLLKKYVGTDEPKENGDVLKCECTSNHASPTGLGKWTLDGVSRYVFSVLYVSKVFFYLKVRGSGEGVGYLFLWQMKMGRRSGVCIKRN